MWNWLSTNNVKKALAFLAPVAASGVATFPANTIAFKVSAVLLGLLTGKGILSSGLAAPQE